MSIESYANRVKKKFVFENYVAARESYKSSLANRKKFHYKNAAKLVITSEKVLKPAELYKCLTNVLYSDSEPKIVSLSQYGNVITWIMGFSDYQSQQSAIGKEVEIDSSSYIIVDANDNTKVYITAYFRIHHLPIGISTEKVKQFFNLPYISSLKAESVQLDKYREPGIDHLQNGNISV